MNPEMARLESSELRRISHPTLPHERKLFCDSPSSSNFLSDLNQSKTASAATPAWSGFRRVHSQTIAKRHPNDKRASPTILSRSMLAANLVCQYSGCVAGVVAYRQSLWRCQKQPCTKTTAQYFGKTRSGQPLISFACTRYRSPRACSARLNTISGLVFFPLIPDIIRDRALLSTISITALTLATFFDARF